MGRRGLSGCTPVAGFEDRFHFRWRTFSLCNLDKCADNGPNHLLEKPVGGQCHADDGSFGLYAQGAHLTNGVAIVRRRPFEGGEIVSAFEGMGCLLKRRQIQWFGNVPQAKAIESRAYRVIQNSVFIGFPYRAIPRMEGILHLVGSVDTDIVWKHAIQRARPFFRREGPIGSKTDDLSKRMHSRIGAPCRDGWREGL